MTEGSGARRAASLERHGTVALIWLDRPDVINAIDATLLEDLATLLDRVEAEEDIRALTIAGRGPRGFCSGADLATVASLSYAAKRRFIETAWRTLDRIADLPVPTVAALHGHVLGGGLELALACDLRVADPGARLGLPEMALGSVPSFGAVQRLPALIGRAKALELLLGGGPIDAHEAQRIGLVTKVIAPGKAVEAGLAQAGALTRLDREPMRFLRTALAQPSGSAAALHGMISDLCHRAPGYQKRIARFREGRTRSADATRNPE